MYQRILVTTDGSALSKKAVRSAIDLAAATGASLIALNVVPRYPMSYFEGGISISTEDVSRIEKKWAEDGQAVVNAVEKLGKAEGVAVKTAVTRSDLVAESIMAAAKKHKCDLIVMASH